ncbi:MAG: ABC transporter permease [Gemmatimonadota bacterium]
MTLRNLFRRRRFEQDLDDELRFHLEMQTARNIERGMTPNAARALAEQEFGRMEHAKDEVRDARGLTWFDDVRRDVRFSLRTLARTPGFVLVVLLCLGLGIGANAAIFSIINTVLLKPLPYEKPDEVVNAYETFFMGSGDGYGSVSWPNYDDWATRNRSFSSLAASKSTGVVLRGTEATERLSASNVTANYFTALGIAPLRGRGFAPTDAQAAEADVVLLNERLWRTRFGADPALIGRTINLDGRERTVIGIIPAAASINTMAWLPLIVTPEEAAARGSHNLAVTGRLRAGVSIEQAETDLKSIAEAIKREHPDQDPSRSARLRPVLTDAVGNIKPTLMILLGAVGLVLLIACANVANLLLARAASRQHEVSVRLALGASRARLVRQFLIESLILATGGAIIGGALAWFGLKALQPMVARALPRASELAIDGKMFVFLLGVAVVSAVLFGLVPALQATRGDLRGSLTQAGMRGSTGAQAGIRSALVVAEIALSLVLLAGAGLLLRGLLLLQGTATGFSTENVLTAHLTLPDSAGAGKGNFAMPLLEAIRTIPGVRSAGMISRLPIQSTGTNGNYSVVGHPAPERGKEPLAEFRYTTPGFLTALDIPIKAGRDFTEQDLRDTTSIILINATLAKREFPNQDPIGQRIKFDENEQYTIVGVVGDVKQGGLDREVMPELHFPARAGGNARDMTLVVRSTVPPTSLTPAIRAALRQLDVGQPLYREMTMDDVISLSLTSRRLNLWLLGVFAAVALVLSATGLYGVIAYLVNQRTREIGIRMALGAKPWGVVAMVMRQGGTLVLTGLALGLIGAAAVTRVIASMLYGVSPRDPITFVVVTAVLGGAALLATFVPARRAARVDPIQAMRSE